MIQIYSILPAQNVCLFQARQSSIQCKSSPFRTLASTPTLDVKKHLKNLENLLPKPEPKQSILTKGAEENKGKNFLQGGLNLARVWPEMKAAEEMSPRNLNMLKRLLSKSNMQYSPRNILGSRWREYHGCNNWSGLLDPLDENLRREVVRYGEFIQAAYHCFHSNPATNEAPMERHVALPDRTYKVTKSLYATSSIGLPKWVDDVAPNLGWMTQRSSWIGYVAVCDDATEIERMGRRDIVIALRGTSTCLEWTENFMDFLVPIPGECDSNQGQAKVECGFQSLFKTKGDNDIPSLEESVVKEVQRLIEQYKGETLSITITGHSLGAALSLLVADKISTCSPNVPPVAVYSFGGPRVGNRSFASRLDSNNVKVMRVVNNQDVITKVPGMFVSEELDKKLRGSPAVEKLLNCLDKMPWAYSHVGTELRLDTTRSPFLKPNADVSCCHDLEAYLHLVDGFLASNCPFRANAKRSLCRLLNEQKSNVKMLYMSKGKDLTLNVEKNNMSMSSLLSPSS